MNRHEPWAMQWHILGAGSIGCLWAGYLAQASYPVKLLLKDEITARQFRDPGLLLENASGLHRPGVTGIQAGKLDEAIDWLLVTTKSFATLEALASVERNFTITTRIILLQNGLGVQEQVTAKYPDLPIIAGTTTDGAFQEQRFHVVHAGQGITRFGSLGNINTGDQEDFLACIDALALDTEWVEDINTRLWQKVAINSCINALTALKGCRNGGLLEDPDSLESIRLLAGEAESVMRAADIAIPLPGLFACVVDVLKATAGNLSSMHQDFTQGRHTEIESINGFICAQGRALNIPTPVNYQLLESVLGPETL